MMLIVDLYEYFSCYNITWHFTCILNFDNGYSLEIEHLLEPEEWLILQQNAAPNLEKVSTVSIWKHSKFFPCLIDVYQNLLMSLEHQFVRAIGILMDLYAS